MYKIIVVAGPTASGKTSFSLELAKRYDGEIISADSMQIYKYMDIGTAKPTREEQAVCPHHLIDFISPFDSFSAFDYVRLAKEKIKDISSRGKMPIVVGGTGLYISSLLDNVEFFEQKTDMKVREELFKLAEEKGNEYLHNMLREIDPVSAEKIHPNNVKRVVRAIEIFKTANITMTEQNLRSKSVKSDISPAMFLLTTDRERLYDRINRRVDIMVSEGIAAEVDGLIKMGLKKDMQSMQGIGYKELFEYFEGRKALDESIDLIKQRSRNYAKRQLTWFGRDERYHRLDTFDEDKCKKAEKIIGEVLM